MSGSLPEMGDWGAVFDETYLRTYVPFMDEERTRTEALGAAALAGVGPGAEILDCPCGFGRHVLVLAGEGFRVTGLDRSETLLAEAERRRGDAEWPRLVRGDYRQLPFGTASFDAVFNLFSALGYLERDEDVGVLREFRRVVRPGGAAGTISTLHLIVAPDGERIERRFVHHVYSSKEWAEMLRAAGFFEVEAFGGWDGQTPATPDAWRLILRAR